MKFGRVVSIIFVLIGICLFAYLWLQSAHFACSTYFATPDVDNFRTFATHDASRFEGKISFLFSLVLIPIIALLIVPLVVGWYVRNVWLVGPVSILMVCAFAVVCLFLEGVQAHSALSAAAWTKWQHTGVQSHFIDGLCRTLS
jgi:hypothetical protein